MNGQAVQVPGSPRRPDDAGELACCQPGVGRRVGEVLLGPGEVHPQSLLGRRQLAGPEETLEHEVAPLPQVGQTTVWHSHKPGSLARIARPPLSATSRCGLPFHPSSPRCASGRDGITPRAGRPGQHRGRFGASSVLAAVTVSLLGRAE
jgi:hypothetical protein